jgi:hypothetical protein
LAEQIITSANIEVGVIDRASAQMQTISNSFNNFNKSLSVVDKSLAVTGAAIGTIGFMIAKFGRSAFTEAARVEELDIAMRAIGASTKIGYKQINLASKAIRDNGIEMAASQQIAIEFAQNNLELARAADIARVAQDLAVIGQKNSTETTMLLVRAIITGRTELLKSSGIQKSAGQMYEEYAQKVGKSTQALSAQEKQTAVINGVMKEGERVAGTYLAAMEAPGKVLRSFPRLFNDMKVEMGSALLEGFGPLIKASYDMTSAFSKAIRGNDAFQKGIRGLGFVVNDLMSPLTNSVTKIKDFIKNLDISEDSVKNVIAKFYQFLPVISAVGVALSTFAGKSILSTIPGLSAFAGALNPIMAGFIALIATSPELRTEVVKLLAAFKPLIPIVLQLGQTIANFLIKVLQIVIPLVRGFAEGLQKFIPSALNFISSNEIIARTVVLVGKGLLLLMATMKIYATAGAMVAFVNKVILGGSFAKLIGWFTATRIASFATALGLKGLAASAGLAATGVNTLSFSLKLFRFALVSTGIGALIVGLGFAAEALMRFFDKSGQATSGTENLTAETSKLDKMMADLEKAMNATTESFDDGFNGGQTLAEGLTDVGDAANEAKKKADELANRIKELNKNAQQAVQTFKDFVFEQTDTRNVTQKVSDAFIKMDMAMMNANMSADELLSSFQDFTAKLREDFSEALSEARSQLDSARQKFTEFRNVIAGSIKGIIRFEKAVEEGDFLAGLIKQADEATKFSDQVKKLIEMGLSESAITRVVDAGYEAGTIIADQIIAGGQTVVNQVNKLVADVELVADAVGYFGAQRFYQAGIDQANALVNGILEQMKTREAELEGMIARLANLLGEKARAEQLLANTTTGGGGGGGGDVGGAGNPPVISNGLIKGTSLTQKEVDSIIKASKADTDRYNALAKFYKTAGVMGSSYIPSSSSTAKAAQKIAITNVRAPLTGGGRAVPLAEGGVVTRPTLALIGEKGAEAVIPLNKAGGMGGGAVYNITVNAGIGTSGQEVGKQIVEAIKKFERSSGPVFAKA